MWGLSSKYHFLAVQRITVCWKRLLWQNNSDFVLGSKEVSDVIGDCFG